MELKQRINGGTNGMADRINRTFMELKLFKRELAPRQIAGINRTFMELKHTTCARLAFFGHRINRTFMELKRYSKTGKRLWQKVLIEPLWN